MTWGTWKTWNIEVKMKIMCWQPWKIIPTRKQKKKNQEDVDKSYGNSWSFRKKLIWIQFEKKHQHCLPIYIWFWVRSWWMTHKFTSYVTYNLSMKHSIWATMFLNETLVSTNCCNMAVLFSAMVEKCSYTLSFCFFFYFLTSSKVKGFSIISLLLSSFEAISKYA